MRRFLRFTSSILASASLALAVIGASVALNSTVKAANPTDCGPCFLDDRLNPPAWSCANPTTCVLPEACYPRTYLNAQGYTVHYCPCL